MDSANDGTQAIRRAVAILKHVVTTSPERGATLGEISESMKLSRSTAHRILKCLVSERLIAQSEDAKHYTVGDLTAELALARNTWQKTILQWRPAVEAVARETGATAYLMGRSGSEAVCLDKQEGSSVIRVIPVEVGQRRPLGVGAGACAILAQLPKDECEEVVDSVAPYLHRYSAAITVDSVREAVQHARRTGFAESRGQVVGDVYGLGIAIPGDHRQPLLALSLAAHTSAATDDKISAWKRVLRHWSAPRG